MKRIRDEISFDSNELKSILNDKEFQSVWGKIKGDEVKTAPRGFDINHPDIDLIKKKQYILTTNLTNNDICSENFIERIEEYLFKVKPF